MGDIPFDTSVKVSTNAAQKFVESYYPALNSDRQHIASFYSQSATMPDGKALPCIVWNGNTIPDQVSLQEMFEEKMPQSRYEVGSYDCQVINANYDPAGLQGHNPPKGTNMSILLTVTGSVSYGEPKSGETKAFSENFVLIPNRTAAHGKGGNVKDLLIQSQNFRLVT